MCGLAPDVPTLVAGRAVAGLGAALEVPASLAILTIAYPDTEERTRALEIWATLLRNCHCHWSDRRRRACRCVRLAQHFPPDHSFLRRDALFGAERGAGIEQPARPPARSSGAGACDCLARQPFTRSDRGAALGLDFNRKRGCAFALGRGGGDVSAPPGGCNRRGDPAAHAAQPRVCGLPCCGYHDELRRLRDAVPHPSLFPGRARRIGTACCSRAAADVRELREHRSSQAALPTNSGLAFP